MTSFSTRLAKHIDNWRLQRETRRATRFLDDRMRRDAGLPIRGDERHAGRTFLFPYLNR